MLTAMEARDAAFDGRFITGVLSTGIYCLPSCKAKNPKHENVRFFDGPQEARAAGLRACKRCRPDAFYEQRDEDELLVEGLLAEVRKEPARFPRVEALAEVSGLGSSKLHELFRRYLHATPAWRLQEARLDLARRRLLETEAPVADVAFDSGYESLSAFNDNFRRRHGLAPLAYRRLLGARAFEIALPESFPAARMLGYVARDPESLTVRGRARGFQEGIWLGERPAVIEVELRAGQAKATLLVQGPIKARDAAEAHGWLLRRLGLTADLGGFHRSAARGPQLAPLVGAEPGLRIPQTGTPFEAVAWAVVGQQVNLPFAYRLLNRVVERAGRPVEVPGAPGLWAPARPAAVADLHQDDLRQVQFSARKAEYLVGVAGLVAAGRLDLEALAAGSARRAERELVAVRGVGPWTARYVMMRGLGFADCVPVGDAGLVRGLQHLYDLDERPDARRTEELMEPFRPYRSLATFHIWQSLEDLL